MVDSLDSYFSRLRVSRLPGRSPAHILDQSPYAFPLKRAITWVDILYTIYSTGLPGPAITAGDKQYIGTGAQFVVYGQDMEIAPESKSIPVAIKQPKFNLDARKRLNLEDPETRKHLHSIQLEIKALTRPELRSHRNIPTLLAWTYDATDFRQPISLVQELAISNMELLLSTRGEQISVSQKSSFCYDIAAALDAIHDCGFSHGDVKPSNVLIFPGKDGFVAKLADFGLSIVETQGEDTKFNIGGTLGWQAPEVQDGMLLGPDGLIKADNYSFGLVAWSTVLGSGRTPPRHSGKDREEWIIRELESAKESDDYATFVALESMVRVVLRADPTQRPFKLLEPINTNIIQNQIRYASILLQRIILMFYFSHFRMTDDDELSKIVAPLNPQLQPDFYWELPTLPDFFIRDLIPHCLENPDILDPPMHFSLFLRLTQKDSTKDRENSLKALLNAAEGGFPPAQALVPLVFASYGLPIPPQIHQRVDGWLISAISTGSVVAREYLEKSHSAATLAALQKFRDYGGYSALYLDLPSLSGLHAAAAYRTKDDIKSMLDMDSSLNIEDGTADGATPLYIACARGSWDIAVELLGRGADASVRCTKYGITCLHWLFAFEASLQCTVAASLVKAGADVNAMITESVSFYHFPFYLPEGGGGFIFYKK
ncbi:hypothetical protein RRF57_006385 [Xylaria bambusicola]|uniref:Protein kinase domain-containing protein n=1 Tax=Xylaria bambusicola TaxID=326684 RepID=A0AAN7UEA3_9PEZI